MKRNYIVAGIAVVTLVVLGILFVPSYLAKQGLDRLAASLPAGNQFTYQDARYSLFSRSLILKGGVLHIADPGIDVTIAEIRVKEGNANLDHAVKTAQEAPSFDDKSETKIADQITLVGAHTVYGPLDAHVDTIEINNPRLGLHELFTPLPPLKTGDTKTALDVAFATGDLRQMLQHVAQTSLATSYDKLIMTGLELTAGDHVSGEAVKLHVDKATGEGKVQGNSSGASLEGLKMEFDSATIAAASVKGKIGDEQVFLTDLRDGQPISIALNHYPVLSETIDHVTIDRNGTSLATIGDISIGNIGYQGGMPVSLDLSVKSLGFDPALIPDASTAAVLRSLDYKPAILDLIVSYKWNIQDRTLTISNTSLALEQGGAISLDAALTDMTPGASLLTAKIAGATVHYTDASLADRWLAYASKLQGNSPAEIKSTYIAWLELQKPNFRNDAPLTAAIDTLEKFVADPHLLTLAIKPAAPVGLSEFDKTHPETFSGKLGLTLANGAASASPH